MGVWLLMEVACSCWRCCHADFKSLFMELWYCWSLLPFYGHSHHPMACRHWIREQWSLGSTSTCHVQGIAKTEHFIFSFREDYDRIIPWVWKRPSLGNATSHWIWVSHHCQLDLSPFTTKSLDSATQPVFNITLPELLCLLGFANIPASSHAAMT